MPRLKTERFRISKNEETVDFKTTINVGTEGDFSTTIPEEMVAYLKARGVLTDRNLQRREGYFNAATLQSLCISIKDAFHNAMSMTLKEKLLVIRYNLNTDVSFCFSEGDKGDIVPNGGWVKPGHSYKWQEGTKYGLDVGGSFSRSRHFGVAFYVEIKSKTTYELNSGKIITKYEEARKSLGIGHLSRPENTEHEYYNLMWLTGITSMRHEKEGLNEIPYTEARAGVFVDLIKGIVRLSENLKFFDNPDMVAMIADSNEPLKLKM